MEMNQGLIEFNWSSLMILCNLFILFLITKKFFWEKIKGFMDARAEAIRTAIEGADATNRKADERLAEYNRKIAGAKEEGRAIIRDARSKADAQADQIIREARKQASDIVAKAEQDAEQERAKAIEDMREEIGRIAILAAEQIVGRAVGEVGQQEIIDEAIENVREGTCQN